MCQAILALDNSKFKHFKYTLQVIQKYPSSLQADKKSITDMYPAMVEIVLTQNDRLTFQLTAEEILNDIKELHAEYIEILTAFELEESEQQSA